MKGIREQWGLLGRRDDVGAIISVSSHAGVDFYINYNILTQKRMFLLRFPSDTNIVDFNNVLFRSLAIQMFEFEKYKELAFLILEDELQDIFLSFAEDLLSQTSGCDDANDVLRTVSNIIFQWLKLFERAVSSVLSPQSEKGLFGELTLLRLLAREGYVLDGLLSAWEGPLFGDVDFSFPTAKLEVKLSSSKHPSLKISSERQLDISTGKRLFLFFYLVNESSTSGETLVDLIDDIRGIMSGHPVIIARFEGKLLAYGYTEDDRARYIKKFSLRHEKVFRIEEGFPRIVPDTLVSGLYNVNYEIEISACEPYRTEYLTITQLINGY